MFALTLLAVGSGQNYQLERLLREIRGELRWGRSPHQVDNWRNARTGEAAASIGLLKFVSADDQPWRVYDWAEDECVVADAEHIDGMESLDTSGGNACGQVEDGGIRFKVGELGEGSTQVAGKFNAWVEGRAFSTEFARPTNVDQPIYSLNQDLPSTQTETGKGVGPNTMNMFACGTLSLNKGDAPSTQLIFEDICIGQDAYFKNRHNIQGIWDEDKRSGFNQYWFLGWAGGAEEGGINEDDDSTSWRRPDENDLHTEYFTKKCVAEYKYMSDTAIKSGISGLSSAGHPASVACNAKWSNGHSSGNGKGLGTVLDIQDSQGDSKVRLGAMKAFDMSNTPWTCSGGTQPVDCFDCGGRPMCPAPKVPVPGKFTAGTSSRYKTNEIFIKAL